MSGKPITGIHYERIDHGWKRETENGTEFHYDIEFPPAPRDTKTVIDRLYKPEAQPLNVADQLTTFDQRMTDIENRHESLVRDSYGQIERVDNIEKHCEAMDGKIQITVADVGFIARYLGFQYVGGNEFSKDRFVSVTPPLETNRFGFEAGSTYQMRNGRTMRIISIYDGYMVAASDRAEKIAYYLDGRAKGTGFHDMDLIHPVTHAEKRA